MDQSTRPSSGEGERVPDHNFLHRVVLFFAVGVAFILGLAAVWFGAHALLLIFACILFAVLLFDLSSRVQRFVKVKRGWALAMVVAIMLSLLVLGGIFVAPQIAEQSSELGKTLPQSIHKVRQGLEHHSWLQWLMGELPSDKEVMALMQNLLPRAGLFFSGVLGAFGNALIIVFVGVYLAAQPGIYVNGVVTLFPQRKRERVREVIEELRTTLARWLFGKAVSMVIVGTASALGLALLDIPLAMILGIIAGLLDFIPYLGPLMAGVPAVLIALTAGPEQALYVIALFGLIQLLEGYVLQPLIENRTVSLPPALTIVMQVMMGAIFGLAGVALATPLAAVLAVLVSMLYVQDVLGDPVRTPSEAHD
jgi:predicted PurR-regulated permease PerM